MHDNIAAIIVSAAIKCQVPRHLCDQNTEIVDPNVPVDELYEVIGARVEELIHGKVESVDIENYNTQ